MLFRNVIVGADGSPEANESLRAARCLLADEGRLTALTVAEVDVAADRSAEWDARVRAAAAEAQAEAEQILAGDERAAARTAEGLAAAVLLETATSEAADLIALGAHGNSRITGILFGSVATRVIHDADCSVLVVRGEASADGFSRGITVGVDSSDCAATADRIAAGLAGALDVGLRRIRNSESPVEDLVEASRSSDLVVVGSRGERGILSLGSVAERVAHRAECAVLVVRA